MLEEQKKRGCLLGEMFKSSNELVPRVGSYVCITVPYDNRVMVKLIETERLRAMKSAAYPLYHYLVAIYEST